MSSRLIVASLTLAVSCTSGPSEEPGTQVGKQYTAVLSVRQAADGTMSTSADILDAEGCTAEVDGAVLVNGYEMSGGYTAGVDACVQSRYVYQLHGLAPSPTFKVTVDGHVLAIVEQE